MSTCLCCDTVYEGDKAEFGLPNGQGMLRNEALLFEYHGSFLDGQRHGRGTLAFLDGALTIQGTFKQGELLPGAENATITLQAVNIADRLLALEGRPGALLPPDALVIDLRDLPSTYTLELKSTCEDYLPTQETNSLLKLVDLGEGIEFEGSFDGVRRTGRKGKCVDIKTRNVVFSAGPWCGDSLSDSAFIERLVTGTGIYSGWYSHGVIQGYGSFLSFEGSYYEGMWSHYKPHGYGVMAWAQEGTTYSGYFHFGRRHGVGSMTWSSGKNLAGMWANDRLYVASKDYQGKRFPDCLDFGGLAKGLSRYVFDNPFADDKLMHYLRSYVKKVLVSVKAHEAHFKEYSMGIKSMPTLPVSPARSILKEHCSELIIKSLEGFTTNDSCQYQLSICVGDNPPIWSSRKRGTQNSVLVWEEKLVLPNSFDSSEKMYIQLFCHCSQERVIVAGGFISLSSGSLSCMLVGRDPETGFRGPVALVRFQGTKIIDLKEVTPEICFTL